MDEGREAAGAGGRGESVWLGCVRAETLGECATVLDKVRARPEADLLRARRTRLLEAVNAIAWDGNWYKRATLDDGSWIGASSNDAGQIYLNPQTWAILTNAAPADRADAALARPRLFYTSHAADHAPRFRPSRAMSPTSNNTTANT